VVMSSSQLADALFRASSFMATPFEKNFDFHNAVAFAGNHPFLPLVLVSLYMAFCYFGSKIMKDRQPFDLRIALAVWNAFLCTFSFLGLCRTVPYMLGLILSTTFEDTVCSKADHSWGNGPCGFWVMLFIFSKIPELIDTVFIVLRKKKLLFLHWYHHVTVLLFCWNSYATMAASGLYFVSMNYTVHALMYGYYCLQALHMCPKSFPAFLITFAQIAQMFVGTGVCIACWYFKLHNGADTCHNDTSNLLAGAAMYASYLYLFCEFAVKRYLVKKTHTR